MRRRLIYRGRVQGVGFRYTVRSVSRQHTITGFVRNLPDGTVELMVEAEAAEMQAFLDDVARALAGNIESLEDIEAGDEPLDGFQIRY